MVLPFLVWPIVVYLNIPSCHYWIGLDSWTQGIGDVYVRPPKYTFPMTDLVSCILKKIQNEICQFWGSSSFSSWKTSAYTVSTGFLFMFHEYWSIQIYARYGIQLNFLCGRKVPAPVSTRAYFYFFNFINSRNFINFIKFLKY